MAAFASQSAPALFTFTLGGPLNSLITFDHVSKHFTLRHERPRSFQELFLRLLHFKRNGSKEEFWALRDVSLEVKPGEMIGIIGPNGAGKSTILKLISGIIPPSSGKIDVNGRISALLELGAGFHPDLTGRENIYLNGSILGFSRADMDRIYDDILDFAELGQFIDVQVKHYSSGMYMRLGFSIAIHVRPDILLVDEILAVGDHAFQVRCLDEISNMKRRGLTIILVTHDPHAVRTMCTRAIWLDDGRIQAQGDVDPVVDQYLAQVRMEDGQALLQAEAARSVDDENDRNESEPAPVEVAQDEPSWRWGSRQGEITKVQFLDRQGQEQRSFQTGETFVVRIHYVAHQRIDQPQFGLALYHAGGFHINGPNTVFSGMEIDAIEGPGYIDHIIENLPLLEGTYLTSVSLYDHDGLRPYDHHHQAYTFRVYPNPDIREKFGSIIIPSSWRLGPTGLIGHESRPNCTVGIPEKEQEVVEDEPSRSTALQGLP
jgi:ABC-type polysaccharide/polyol phosphate transport system ATPase subunit